MLLIKDTLEAIRKRIMYNDKIMTLMNLPVLDKEDSEKVLNQKINQVIKRAITISVQNPKVLGEKATPVKIGNVVYDKYLDTRMTISILQSNTVGGTIFGNPRIEINIYYDNNNPDNALKILDLLSNEFSGKDLNIVWEEDGNVYTRARELKCVGVITQNPNINNYEVCGIRFSFYVSHYVPYN